MVDVYMKGCDKPGRPVPETGHAAMIDNEPIWELLQLWIPKITEIVKENHNKEAFTEFYPDKPNREPELHWVFSRKYSPNDDRNSLRHHVDTNMNTVSIELINDYEGGECFI